ARLASRLAEAPRAHLAWSSDRRIPSPFPNSSNGDNRPIEWPSSMMMMAAKSRPMGAVGSGTLLRASEWTYHPALEDTRRGQMQRSLEVKMIFG
ncbi:hypothetical protein T310_7008, partial [Rasamsonia emersonii CBS 393.64]